MSRTLKACLLVVVFCGLIFTLMGSAEVEQTKHLLFLLKRVESSTDYDGWGRPEIYIKIEINDNKMWFPKKNQESDSLWYYVKPDGMDQYLLETQWAIFDLPEWKSNHDVTIEVWDYDPMTKDDLITKETISYHDQENSGKEGVAGTDLEGFHINYDMVTRKYKLPRKGIIRQTAEDRPNVKTEGQAR